MILSPIRTRVGPVFSNSFYIQTRGLWICVVASEAPIGPLSMRCGLPDKMDFRALGLRSGLSVHLNTTSILVPPLLRMNMTMPRIWRPPCVVNWTLESLHRGVHFTQTWIRNSNDVQQTLTGNLFFGPKSSFGSVLARSATDAAERIGHWVSGLYGQTRPDPEFNDTAAELTGVVQCLTGLGPGLTPAGDDFLGGAIIALHHTGHASAAQFLYKLIATGTAIENYPISASHLKAAAAGACSSPVHDALRDILLGEVTLLPSTLTGLGTVGHTSGWDALAGMLVVLQALSAKPNH